MGCGKGGRDPAPWNLHAAATSGEIDTWTDDVMPVDGVASESCVVEPARRGHLGRDLVLGRHRRRWGRGGEGFQGLEVEHEEDGRDDGLAMAAEEEAWR